MIDPIPDIQIQKSLACYGVAATPGACSSVREYITLLLKWNAKVSLTTVVDPVEILRFHFGESLFAAANVPISHGRLADVGSGAGFPGLPLAIFLPDVEVVLVESNLKKATFLSEVIRTLQLKNISVWRGRLQEMTIGASKFYYVTARALGHYEDLLNWSEEALNAAGKIVLWIGEDDAAKISNEKRWNWRAPVRIPDSTKRVLLVGSQA